MAGYTYKGYSSGDITAAYLRRAKEKAKLSDGTNALEVYRQLARESGTGAQGTVSPSAQVGQVQASGSKASVGGRVVATGLDAVGQLLEGVGHGVEGIFDFALGLITMPAVIGEKIGSAIGGRDGTWDDAIKDIMAYDVTSSIAGAVQEGVETVTGLDVLTDSYQNEGWGQYAREIEQGIGGMLPAVAVSIATAGAGAPAAVSSMASLATLGAGAAGQSAQEAYAEGASYGEGMTYGAISGGIEVASEKLFGGVNKVVSGTGFLDDVVPSVAKKGAARIAANFVEEGAEEVVSDLLNPLAKTVYQGRDALKEYGTQEYWQDMGKSFLVGGATATVYSGTVGYGLSRAGVGHVGKEADVESLLEDIDGLARKERNARAHGKLTDELSARIHSEAVSRYADIQDILTSGDMKESRRAKIMGEFSLGKAFDADGRMNRAFGEEIGYYKKASATGAGAEAVDADGAALHAQYYAGRRGNVEEALRTTGMTAVQSLTTAEQEGYRAFLKAESRLESLIGEESPFAGDKLSFAIVEPDADGGRSAEGAYVRGQRTILLSREALADPTVAAQELQSSWFGILIEESLHMANDTPGLTAVVDADGQATYTSRYLELKELLWDGKDSVIEELLRDGYFRDFGKNQSEIKKTIDRLLNKKVEKMSEVELQQREVLFDEVIAHLGRNELSTKHFYERLVKADPTVAERILEGLRGIKEKLSSGRTADGTMEAELSERSQRAEELFLEAMSEAGVQVSADGRILDGDRTEDEEQAESGTPTATRPEGNNVLSRGSAAVDSIAQERANVNPSDEKNVRTAQNSEDIVRYSRAELNKVAEEYGIHSVRALNDYVGVQKKVIRALTEDGFFENGNNIVYNEATGYEIEIGKKGIQETFGPEMRFQGLPTDLKKLKLATVRDLPAIIQNAKILETGVADVHNNTNQVSFDYLEGVANVSGESYRVKIVVKKSAIKNRFYMHEVQLENGAPFAPVANGTANDITVLTKGDTVTDSIAQKRANVNPSDENNVRTARKRAVETTDDRFSRYNAELKETFRQNIDQWEREGRPQDEVFAVGVAGDIVQGLGAQESTVRLYGEKVDRILHDHPEITLKEIKQIPQILDDPAVVLKSKYRGGDNSRLIFIGDVKAQNGLPVMVILDVDSADKQIRLGSIEKVASVYTKTGGLGNFLRTSGFVYVNKKKATDLLIVTDLHNGLHPAPMIDGFVGSISHPGGNVNIHAKSFSEIFSDDTVRTARKRAETADSRAFEDAIERMEEHERGREKVPENDAEYVRMQRAAKQKKDAENTLRAAHEDVKAGTAPRNPRTAIRGKESVWQKYADLTQQKSFSRQDARKMLEHIQSTLNYCFAEGYQQQGAERVIMRTTDRVFGQAADALWQKLNTVQTEAERRAVFRGIAEYMLDETNVRVLLNDEVLQQQGKILDTLRTYTHKLELDELQADIQAQFDKDGAKDINRIWRTKKGTEGLRVEEVAAEFSEITGVQLAAEHPADMLAELEHLRRQAMEAMASQSKLALADGINAEERSGVLDAMVEGLEYEWKKGGTKSTKARMEEAIRAGAVAERESQRRVTDMQAQMESQKRKMERHEEFLQKYVAQEKEKLAGQKAHHEELLQKYVAQQKEKLARQKERLEERWTRARKLNTAKYKADRIKTWKSGEFRAASEPGNADLLGALGSLGAVDQQGNFSPASARKAMATVADWYAQPAVQSLLGATFDGEGHAVDGGMWRQEMLDKMRRLAEGRDAQDPSKTRVQFTVEDADDLILILDHARKIVEEAYYVRVGGKRVKAKEAAERYARVLAEQGNRLRNTMFGRVIDRYRIEFYDPASLMRWYDGYAEHGFLQDMHAMFRQSEFETDIIRTDMTRQLVDFEAEHKKYFTRVEGKSVTVDGCELPLMNGLYLTLALERDQAIRHLMEGGFRYVDAKGNDRRVGALLSSEDTSMDAMKARAEELRADIMSQLSAEDKAFLQLARKLFNEDCKEHKRRTDLERFGYTNVLEGAYIPIRIADKTIRVDTADYRTEIDRATNAAFNKNTNEHAANAIIVGDLLEVLTRHIDGIARYAGLSESIRTYETLLNIDANPAPGEDADIQKDKTRGERKRIEPNSVRRVLETVWPDRGNVKGAASYLNDMVSDIQHISPVKRGTSISQMLERVRGRAAVAVLGANPKVLATQFSSLFAAASVLDAKYITKGMVMKADRADIETYCKLAYLRRVGNDSVRAQGVVDQISKVGEFCTALIGKTDSFVVDRLWNACLLQAAEQTHAAMDSEVCKRAAGELLTDVIYETQQNAQMSERSYAMRSGNFIDKVVTMFSADSMKIVGRVLDAAGAYKAAKGTNNAKAQQAAARQYRRAVGALASQAVYMAVVATLFRKLLAYDDDDTLSEWSAGDIRSFLGDVLSSAVGGLPIIKECVEFFQTGYDIEDMGVGALNDLLSAVKNVVALPKEAITGELTGEQAATRVRSVFYSLGQITGIPIRNVYKYSRGVLNVVNDVSGSHVVYRLDSVFNKSSLSADLAAAIEKGDTEQAQFIAGLALDERVDLARNASLRQELIRLCMAGESVLPRSVGSEVTWDGETYQLTARQKKRFEAVYSEAGEAAARLIRSSYYKEVSDTVKAKALKRIYEIYYNLAIEDFLGVASETKAVLFSKAIPAEKLAVVVAAASELQADTDTQGRVISGSKRRRVAAFIESLRLSAAQKYMIFAYLGYREASGEAVVTKYVDTLKLEDGEREQLLQWCGYAA